MVTQVFDRELLRRRRARAARDIQQFDFLLDHCAQECCERLDVIQRTFASVVDVGAHHGVLSGKIGAREQVEEVVSVDDCEAVLKQSPGTQVLADIEQLPFEANRFDLAVSALSLPLVNDVPGVLFQIVKLLKPDGLFLGVMLGGETLRELREAFTLAEEEMEGGVSPRIAPFIDVRDAGALLQRAGFALPVADADIVTVSYETPFHLMRDLRGMGAANVLVARSRRNLRRSTLMRMVEIYQDRFSADDGRVSATFEFVYLSGWKPHESQQKPLKPGSAQVSLADVLGDGD